MKIDKLDIWGFGKFKNERIKFSENLNIIYGKNESGKSTLQWFILSMLFGMKGKRIQKDGSFTPEKRFEPWHTERYGGLITYTTESGDKYTVERNFNKKTCAIYNKNLKDISEIYDISKTKGIDILGKQFDMNEELFLRTSIIKQQEGRIDRGSKEELISQIVNIYQTGYEDISLNKAQSVIKKTINEKIGTNRTDKRPINIIDEKLNIVKRKIKMFSSKKEHEKDLEVSINNINKKNAEIDEKIENIKKELPQIEKMKKIDSIRKELDIINYNHKRITDLEIENVKFSKNLYKLLDTEKEDTEEIDRLKSAHQKKKRRNIVFLILSIIILIVTGGFGVLDSKFLIGTGIAVIFTILFIIKISGLQKGKKAIEKLEKGILEIQNMIHNNKGKIEVNKKGIEEKLSDLSSFLNKKIESSKEVKIRKLVLTDELETLQENLEKYKITNDIKTSKNKYKEIIYSEIETLNKEKVSNMILLKEMEIHLNSYIENKEKIQLLYEEKEELLKEGTNLIELKDILELSSKLLEESAIELKNDFTPGLIKEMGKTVKIITDNKYSMLSTDNNLMLKVIESEDNAVRDVLNLSNGAIDQMYMILRLAVSTLISKGREKMPIIFDEPFMQFDDIRIKNSLEVLKQGFDDRQIIIFTCKEREIEIIKDLYKENLLVIQI